METITNNYRKLCLKTTTKFKEGLEKQHENQSLNPQHPCEKWVSDTHVTRALGQHIQEIPEESPSGWLQAQCKTMSSVAELRCPSACKQTLPYISRNSANETLWASLSLPLLLPLFSLSHTYICVDTKSTGEATWGEEGVNRNWRGPRKANRGVCEYGQIHYVHGCRCHNESHYYVQWAYAN